MTDFYTPFIVDDSFDHSIFAGEHFEEQIQAGLQAKPGPFFSMSAYDRVVQRDMLDYQHEAPGYDDYGDGSSGPQIYYDQTIAGHASESEFAYLSDDGLSTPDQKKVPLMATQGRQQSIASIPQPSYQPESTQENRRKRKCDSPQYDVAPPPKKIATTQLQVDSFNGGYYDVSGQTSPYSSFIPTPNSATSFHPSPVVLTSARTIGHHYSTSAASQVSLAAPSPHTPATWSPSFATVRTEPSPPAPTTPVPRPATASPLRSSIPKLVRTSTMQQSSPVIHGSMNPVHVPAFNPYAMYPLKATLKLRGDLDNMMKNWTEKEVDCRRRLVEFKRTQEGCTINTDFKAVAPEDRAPSSIAISCILWKEKKEYFVTSVDTIYLLEALVGVRFTVEEKNRIRRNLEGFRPATVSKSKADSEDFFKTIMGFPHPKPRNIEKDVKVFPWKVLSTALKKIISKYSASYSSTASSLLTPVPSNYTGIENSADYGYQPSPPPQYVTPMTPYPMAHPAMYHGPIPGRMSAPVTTAPVPELQLQVPPCGPAYDMNDAYVFNTMPGMPQASMLMRTEAMSAPAQRLPPTWEFSNYINNNPASAPPNSAPQMAYHRGPIETADFVTPTGYRMR